MAGKNWITVAPQFAGTFATAPVSGWADIPVVDLGGHVPIVARQQADVMVRDQVAPTLDGMRTVVRGGTGTIKPHLRTRGMLLYFAAILGEPTSSVVSGMNRHRFDLGATMPTTAIAAQVGKEFSGGGQDKDSYWGGQPVSLKIGQGLASDQGGVSADGIPTVEVEMNYAQFDGNPALVTSAILEALNYSGADCTTWIGPTLDDLDEECFTEFGLEIPSGFDLANARCISSTSRDQAGRAGEIAAKLTLGRSYKNRLFYDAWINGTPMAQRTVWSLTDGGNDFSVTIDIPCILPTGDAAQESKTEVTKQNIPADIYGTLDEDDEPVPPVSIIVDTDELWNGLPD